MIGRTRLSGLSCTPLCLSLLVTMPVQPVATPGNKSGRSYIAPMTVTLNPLNSPIVTVPERGDRAAPLWGEPPGNISSPSDPPDPADSPEHYDVKAKGALKNFVPGNTGARLSPKESVAELPGRCEFLGKYRLHAQKACGQFSVFPWECIDVMNSATLSHGRVLQNYLVTANSSGNSA